MNGFTTLRREKCREVRWENRDRASAGSYEPNILCSSSLDQLFINWSAVNRISRKGEVIGENQKVTPYEGLQAMTINVSLQYQEENSNGSISQGKLADLVILDKKPLKVEPVAIKDIKVLETLKEGNTIYKK